MAAFSNAVSHNECPMSSLEEKWQANQDKAAFLKQFPGLLNDWTECRDKRIRQVTPLARHPGVVIVFDDGTFLVAPKLEASTPAIQDALEQAHAELRSRHPKAFNEMERLVLRDKELSRKARLEKILGAIENNLGEIPELKQELRDFLERLPK